MQLCHCGFKFLLRVAAASTGFPTRDEALPDDRHDVHHDFLGGVKSLI